MWMLGIAEQARNLAISALRGVFAGIGQLLLAADRFKADEADGASARADRNGGHDPLVQRPARQRPARQSQQRWRSLDPTGNVRLLTNEEHSESPGDQRWGDAGAPRPSSAAVTAASPPIPGYDDLSIASLRARLRGLNADQVSQLADYERSHANRLDIVTMFERRIAKLVRGDD